MKLLITTDLNNILTDHNNLNISSFTEYGMKFSNIESHKISNHLKSSDYTYKKIIVIPMTHINNIWHLMHHVFITYKYLKKYNINCDNMYPIFFKGFYHRQGNISECQYNDLIFKGLGFDYNKFKNNYEIFKQNKYINVSRIYHVNENINFINEPLFNDFKKDILNNFNIKYQKKKSKNITFILRKGTREITNIDEVKHKLQSYTINYIYLENYTIKEQIEIIANTDILIGVHGAGLTWCVFMKNNSTLIEIYPGNSNTDNYIRWCKISNLKYQRLTTTQDKQKKNQNFRALDVTFNQNQIDNLNKLIINYYYN